MSLILRALLLLFAVGTALYVHRKLGKAQMQVYDTVFWILFAVLLVVLSVFPNVAIWCAVRLGVISPVNFIFLVMIFLLFLLVFLLSIKLSNLQENFKSLVEELAVRDNLEKSEKESPTK